MRLNNVLLAVFLLVAALLPVSIRAENVLIFMDNSKSITDLKKVYQRDIEVIMGVIGSNRLYFAAIGDSHTQACQMLDSSMPESERRRAIGEVFSFADWHTPIYESLNSVESCDAFKRTDNILIISDMQPDYQRSAGDWVFDRQDINDVGKSHTLLKSWIDQGKQLHIVLHDWQKAPQRDNKAFNPFIYSTDKFNNLLKKQLKKARKQKLLVKEPWVNQKLVALSLVELQEYKPNAVHFIPMPTKIKIGDKEHLNHEGFRHVLCGFLPISPLKAGDVCDIPIKKAFSIAIDIAPRLPLSRYFNLVRKQITKSELIGPVRHFKVDTLKKGQRQTSQIGADFYFRMLASSGTPYQYPKLMTFAKDATGQWLPDNTFSLKEPDSGLTQDGAARWLAASINEELTKIVKKYYKVHAPLKTIYLKSQGHAKLGKHKFSVLYRFEGNPNDERSKRRLADDGMVKLPIPKEEISYAKLYVSTADGKYLLGDLPIEAINSPADIEFTIPEERKVSVTLQLTGVESQNTQVEVFYQGDEKVSVYKGTYLSQSSGQVSLLPGNYYWEATPVNDYNILGTLGELKVSHPENLVNRAQQVQIELFDDPLKDRSQWHSEIGSLIGSGGSLTETGYNLIDGSAYFFIALLDYTSTKMAGTSPSPRNELQALWKAIKGHIKDLSTDRKRLLKRSMRGLGLGGKVEENLLNLDIMFDMFIKGRSSSISGSTSQAQKARDRYRQWIKKLSRRYKLSSQLSNILIKG